MSLQHTPRTKEIHMSLRRTPSKVSAGCLNFDDARVSVEALNQRLLNNDGKHNSEQKRFPLNRKTLIHIHLLRIAVFARYVYHRSLRIISY